jgi:indolepyruvate ferredoxin oxidoreductase beta subunit
VAMTAGYDVKKTDTLGMAQRGGSVVSHVRIAGEVRSPLIKEGDADILIAFEKLEAARWSYFLNKDAAAIVNNQATPPLSVSLGTGSYPDDKTVEDILKQRAGRLFFVDGTQQAQKLGDIRTLNMLMLGCVSSLLLIDVKIWKDCIAERLSPKILEMNMLAFDKGREEMSRAGVR